MPFKFSPQSLKVIDKAFILSLTFISGILLVYLIQPDKPKNTTNTVAAGRPTPKKEVLSDAGRIRFLLEDVHAATAYKYDAKDDRGNGLDTIKVIQTGRSEYLGIYHYRSDNRFFLKLAESTNLMDWSFITDLDTDASMGDIATFPEGDFLISYEKSNGPDSFINVRHYNSIEKIKKGEFSKEVALPRSLSQTNEGTPNFIKIDKSPFDKKTGQQDWEKSKISIGFHYYTGTVDKNATGILTEFTTWKTKNNSSVNDYFGKIEYKGNYGDRDFFSYTTSKGTKKQFGLYEAQKIKNDWASWRSFLVDMTTREYFEIELFTHAGSAAAGNPTITALILPDGTPGYFVSYYLFGEGAAQGEAGELIFYTENENISKAIPRNERPPAPTQSPAVTCTCNTPGGIVPNNGFTCSDGDSRYCAVNERCTEASTKPSFPCALIDGKSTPTQSPTPTTKTTTSPTPTLTTTKSSPTSKPASTTAPANPTSTPTRAPTATNTPVPTAVTTCTCSTPGGTAPNNGFSCTDGTNSYCAENEYCTNSSIKPAWPCATSSQPTATPTPGQSITCTCNTPGGTVPNNGFSCTDGTNSYCAENEHCTTSAVKPAWPCAAN